MTDEQTEALKRFNDEQAKIVAEYVKKSVIEELKKIKNEIRNKEDGYGKYPVCDNCIKIIDKHIKELKGKTE